MKSKNYLLKIICLFSIFFWNASNAQDWTVLGTEGFSAGMADLNEIAVDNNGVPYVIFRDDFNLNKATVMKYDGSSWVYVGGTPGISHASVTNVDISIDANNVVYILYKSTSSSASNRKVTVMKFNGTSWENVGVSDFQEIDVNAKLAVNRLTNKPYVAYRDYSGGKANVKMFDGITWVNVGAVDFSPTYVGAVDFTINSAGIPYIAFSDSGTGLSYKATVMKYNGQSWEFVGVRGFSTGRPSTIDIAVSNDGTPYIAYYNDDNFNLAAVMKFNGTDWTLVGPAAVSSQPTYDPRIKIYKNAVYLTYQDSNIWKNQVKRFDGSNWVDVGTSSLNNYNGGNVLDISANGRIYLAGRNNYGKQKVTYFDATLGISDKKNDKNFSVYPNPASNSAKVNLGKYYEYIHIEIYDVSGNLVRTDEYKNIDSFSLSTSEFAKGLYFINIQSAAERTIHKLLVK
ncbi:T9SS type A sorting domain-containing protein [Flavobacterium tructae]|uniref:T9SS type A sorting domain-containing protein n=1 Tax=Flavobacterium tructae TaxID=1114873 RepID=UPI0035A8EE65